MSEPAFISLGSNIDPFNYLPAAIEALIKMSGPLDVSRVYRSPAVGPTKQADFFNSGARFWTNTDAFTLRAKLREIESTLGRVRTEDKYAPRTIDLDLILLGSHVIQSPDFTLPDPGLLKYGHIAIPLSEIDPSFIHPITKETLGAITSKMCPDIKLQLDEGLSEKIINIADKEF